MAPLNSSDLPRSPAPPRSSAPATATTATPKLRESCHACAASKLKCSKEKPTCARCAKRGKVCEYFAAKRAGRKYGSSRQRADGTNKTTTLPPAPTAPVWSPSFGAGTDSIASIDAHISVPQPASNYQDILPSLLSSTEPTSVSTPATLITQFDDFFASPISFSMLDVPDTDCRADSHDANNLLVDPCLMPDVTFSVLDEAVSLSNPQTPPNSRPSTTSGIRNFEDFPGSPCCLTRALGLLDQLFPNASMRCTTSGGQSCGNGVSQPPTLQCIIAKNKQTIEAISSMLHCPCSQDPYLLSIMSLVVFKILGWYAAAARETPVSDGSHGSSKNPPDHHFERVAKAPTVVGSYCVDGEEKDRMAAQLVLSELHRAQRLVNALSHRLKDHGKRNMGVGTPGSSATDGQDLLICDGESTFPLSATLLDQLEVDLRKRLRALSAKIIDMLRGG